MKEFKEIIEVLKDIVSCEKMKNGINEKVLDKEISTILGVSSTQLATCKSRNNILFEEILIFCAKRKISLNSLFFDQLPESLVDNTNKMYTHRYHIAG